jgi:hypothetical protein
MAEQLEKTGEKIATAQLWGAAQEGGAALLDAIARFLAGGADPNTLVAGQTASGASGTALGC